MQDYDQTILVASVSDSSKVTFFNIRLTFKFYTLKMTVENTEEIPSCGSPQIYGSGMCPSSADFAFKLFKSGY